MTNEIMKPGDYIVAEDVKDQETLNDIRSNVRALGYEVSHGLGYCITDYDGPRFLLLDEDGDLIWSLRCGLGRRWTPAELLGTPTSDVMQPGDWVAGSEIGCCGAADRTAKALELMGVSPFVPDRPGVNVRLTVTKQNTVMWIPTIIPESGRQWTLAELEASVKPQTFTLGGVEVPMPLTVDQAKQHSVVYSPSVVDPDGVVDSGAINIHRVAQTAHFGMAHATREAAQKHAEALQAVTRQAMGE